jgi:hypothetical protein
MDPSIGTAMRIRTCLLLVGVSFAAPGVVRAEDASGRARADARKLAEKGDAAFSEGRCDKAVDLWQEANGKFHAPTILVRVAQCQALLGKVVEATATLETVANASLAPDAPGAFVDAQNRAKAELPKLRARIARIRVVIHRRDRTAEPALEIDNTKMPRSAGDFNVNPGEHHVRVSAGDASWDATVRLTDGGVREVTVGMEPETGPAPGLTQARVGYVVGGLGIGAMVVGGFFGLQALSISRELDGSCGPDRSTCPPESSGRLDKLKTDALVADVTLGAGAVLFAGGAVLVLTDKGRRGESPRWRFVPTGTGAAVVGRF